MTGGTIPDYGRVLEMRGLRADLRLIHPLHEDFSVYGDAGIQARCREWALRRHYLLADGVPACAHGLYLMYSCPGRYNQMLDHASLWVPDHGFEHTGYRGTPFVLAHLYRDELPAEVAGYAAAHGLALDTEPDTDGNYGGDAWYGHGTLAVRLSLPGGWPAWPIELAATVLLDTQPPAWPDEDEPVTDN